MGVFLADQIATMSSTVRDSSQTAGFGFLKRDGTSCRWVNEGKIRTNPEFVEVWQIGCPEARLSQPRRQQRWGWLNRAMFHMQFTGMGARNDSRPYKPSLELSGPG
jgi:hypothetical protein